MHDAVTDLELARTTAARAARLLMELRGDAEPSREPQQRRELGGLADRRANDLILEALRTARPGDAILSEEEVDDPVRLLADRVWIVDPLDGTWEYIHGRADFAVQIALLAGGRLTTAVVDLPAAGIVRTTNDAPAALPALPSDRPYRIVVSRTRPPAGIEAIAARWADLIGHDAELLAVGSVGAKVEAVLSGRAEAYLHDTGFKEWDLAAPMAVAERYGLVVEHTDGSPIRLNRMPPVVPSVLVTRPELAVALRAAVQG